MSNQQWQEGKTYQFKPAMIEEFKSSSSCNKRIAILIRDSKFTVERIGGIGSVRELVEFRKDDVEIEYWFEENEIKYFDLVEATVESSTVTNTNNIRPNVDIVVEFLEKLSFVGGTDYTVSDMFDIMNLAISTDHGDIVGATNIYEFIAKRYDLLQQNVLAKKNKELMERKAKLEAELAEVNKELGNV